MTLDEIKAAVDAGKTVRYGDTKVTKIGADYVVLWPNFDCVGLTYLGDSKTNFKPEWFFVEE